MAATGIEVAGACGGWARGGGGGGGGGGGAAAAAAGDDEGGGAAAGFGDSTTGGGATVSAAVDVAPPVAPISNVHNFCPGLTVSPSLAKISFKTPFPGAFTGTEVYN